MHKALFIISVFMLGILLRYENQVPEKIRRLASSGFEPIALSDSLKKATTFNGDGIYIGQVTATSAPEALPLQKGDILISINDRPIRSKNDLALLMRGKRAGDTAHAVVWRNGTAIKMQWAFPPKAMEQSENYDIIYDQYAYDKGNIRSIIYKPHGDGPFPAVFFIQGFGCYSIEMPAAHPYTKLFNAFAEAGFVVIRTEKPAMGDSEGYCPCPENGLHYEIDALKAGLESLKNYKFIDTSAVFYWGHSLGGVIAPVLAREYPPAGIAVYGTVLRPWQEFLPQMLRFQMPYFGMSYGQTDTLARKSNEILVQLIAKRKSPQQITEENPELKAYLKSAFQYDGKDKLWGKHWTYLAQIDDFNLPAIWSKLNVPVLVLHGEFDFESCLKYEPQRLAEIVNSTHPGQAEFHVLKGTTHTFVKAQSYQHGLDNRTLKYFKENFNPEVPQKSIHWMQEILKRK